MANKVVNEIKENKDNLTITDFLEGTPPNQLVEISDLVDWKYGTDSGVHPVMRTPEIQLYCANEDCNGTRFFRCVSGNDDPLILGETKQIFITYRCSNCQKSKKTYALAAVASERAKPEGRCIKIGELPTYSPPLSPKLINLIGPDRDEFLKGLRSEHQGLGIGAFVYYRKVVETQKNRIISEIIKVSEKNAVPQTKTDILCASLGEPHFNRALEMAKDAMPEALLIDGYSPIKLLHDALNVDVDSLTDEQCLDLAKSIRVLLAEFAERLSQALKDEKELKQALSTLMQRIA